MHFLASFYSVKRDREGETTLVLKIDATQETLELFNLDDRTLLDVSLQRIDPNTGKVSKYEGID